MRLNFHRDETIFKDSMSINSKYVVIILLIAGISLLFVAVMFSNGVGGLTPLQVVTAVAVILIIIAIGMSARRKLYATMISFGILTTIYYIEGIVLAYFHAVPQPFSIGIASVIVIWGFVHWISKDGLKPDDMVKIIIFILVAAVLNITGIIPQWDATLAKAIEYAFKWKNI